MILRRLTFPIAILMAAFAFADSLTLKNGAIHKGELIGMEAGFVKLAIMDRTGEVELRIDPAAINRWDFDDAQRLDSSLSAPKLPSLQSAFDKRYPFFEYLSHDDQSITIALAKFHLEKRAFSKVLDLCKLLKRTTLPMDIGHTLDLIEMEAAWKNDDLSLAKTFAAAWVASERSSEQSALPWLILALHDYQSGRYQSARLHSLHPIAFAKQNLPPFLAENYALAINTATLAGDLPHAHLLKTEMDAKHLNWPPEFASAPKGNKNSESQTFQFEILLKGNP